MPEEFQRLGLALAIGFLVGVERGWRGRDIAEGGRTAGIRTYALMGLLGGVAALLAETLGGWAFATVGLPLAAAFILFKQHEQQEEDDHSVTAIVAALMVFALGAYACIGDWRVAAAAAVIVTALLAFKPVLHDWLRKLTWPELRSALILLAMSFVALPLLPDQAYGPWDSVNPRELWLLTIAMAGISFLAYVAMRVLGPTRGVIVASLAGALVSSTAVTIQLGRLNRQAPDGTLAHAGGALLAGGVMVARIAAIAAVLAPALFQRLLPPLAAFAVVSAILGVAAAIKSRDGEGAQDLSGMKSPFDLGLVLKFALVLGVVMAAARILSGLYGAGSLLPVAALAGLVDVDAITLTVSRMVEQGLDLRLAALAVLVAAAVDSVSKSVIALVVGGKRFGLMYAAGTVIAGAAAGAALLWQG
ncbi:MgtC/SapB family protein [Phenylobacterium kunshanense]|uniref:Uncharacterized protein n=1 Tax=Phenylobacterium kunshanense TaxID=1445034 RepID=A0A328BR53_9CAUL|nr:MgtC/SapB family protein [Phenylobacterium kunshanense]RAK68486.1 hypothetical protein DJ019_00190 [Phenylobacterium kunshanense]